ncbi:methyltransferase domain-containing protein [Vibrio sp. YMD68]|uniref:class I SAM-dependent methyltransferase n=1 Tax=Vibrio sp. YMD68 TaxID=3042300 RepID=UPI00249BE68F|nr:methyltransferase domain-containing protein [Vibrio sp. YMD68]WGW01762.1 methyltransferase domain-containing protein [Vibrio sp. YMD68]
MSVNITFYNENAFQLAKQYDSIEFESVHQSWQVYWPSSGGRVLDVGAGSGRDVRWFAQQGCSVVAVEPAKELRQLGILNSSPQVVWLDDSLPALTQTRKLSGPFDLILVSAVWMHLDSAQRAESLITLSKLLCVNGILVITLRHGCFKDDREENAVSVEEIEQLTRTSELTICSVVDSTDTLNRDEVFWQTVVLVKSDSDTNGE